MNELIRGLRYWIADFFFFKTLNAIGSHHSFLKSEIEHMAAERMCMY